MWSSTLVSVVGAALALAACSDPELAITVRYDDPDLPGRLQSLTLAVIELPPHPDGSPVECDEVRFGRISREQLDGGRRASASAMSGTAGVSGVPRLGEKLLVLEGRDGGGRIAGGCTEVGDIERDTTVEITAEVAPKVRLIGARGTVRDPSDPPADFDLALFRPWKNGDNVVALAGVPVEIDLRDRAADRARIAAVTSCDDGTAACADHPAGTVTVPLTTIKDTLTPALQPGPIEVLVRAPWLEEPLVGRAFEPLSALPGTEVFLAPLGMQRVANQAAPSWAAIRGAGLRAAAIYVSGGDLRTYRIVLIENRNNELTLVRREIVVGEPVFSVMAWGLDFWTRTGSGWRKINFLAGTLGGGDGPDEAATEMIAIEPCEGMGPKGLLVRAGDGPYVAYNAPGDHAPPADPLADLARAVNALDPGRLISTVCLSYPSGVRRTAVVRGETRDLMTGLTTIATFLIPVGAPGRLPSPIASGFLGYKAGSWRLAGATLDVTGPRLLSYTLTGDQLIGGEDGRLDGELTTLPLSTSVADLDQDGDLDLVATSHEVVGETRIQVTYLGQDGRAPLTGLSPPFRGLAPLVSLDRVEQLGWVATVASSDKLQMFALEPR